jgi:hypothetical protein
MRILVAPILATLLSAQSSDLFTKAPPDVDSALRAKVSEFYTLHSQSKFRAAEKLVCEDSKDAYFDSAKRAYKSFAIIRVNYDPGFRSAKVVTNLEGDFFTQQGTMTSMMPWTSHWRVEASAWCYYIPPIPKEVQTPFGVSKRTGEAANPAVLGTAAAISADPKRVLAELAKQVQVSRTEMRLKGYEASSDEIEIRNGTPGPLEISCTAGNYPGLRLTLSPEKLPAGQTARVRLDYVPKDRSAKPTYNFTLTIEPLAQQVQVRVLFDLPEELKKALPKDVVQK